ncbi:MAG TPA: hypothetical protein PLF22_01135 [Pseudomonadales bacterium]|nr:hypothetical protein [Pseudomonadales bacterium]
MQELSDYFFPFQMVTGPALASLLENMTYQSALRFFCYNSLLTLMVLLWGSGFAGLLIRYEKNPAPVVSAAGFAFLSITVGMALLVAELFLLVLCKSLDAGSLTLLFAATTLLAASSVLINASRICHTITPSTISGTLITLTVLLLLAVYQFASLDDWRIGDPTSFHVPYADFFLLNRGLAAYPEFLIYPFHSLNFNLVYSLGLLVERNLAFLQTMHALPGTLTVFGVYAFCNHLRLRYSVVLLTLWFFMAKTFAVFSFRSFALVDNPAMYFILGTVFGLYVWKESRMQWPLVVSAICFGIAMGIKYLMCIFALPVALTILYSEKGRFKSLLVYIAWAAGWGLWWYIRNFIMTGNPVHPFASNIFGMYLWDADDVRGQMSGLLDERIPRNVTGFLLMPFYAWENPTLHTQGVYIIFSLLYLSTALAGLSRSSMNMLLVFCWVYCTFWFFGAQDARYLMPIMPLVFIYIASLLDKFFSTVFDNVFGRLVTTCLFTAALLALLAFTQERFLWLRNLQNPVESSAYDLMLRNNPEYDLVSHANEIFGARQTAFEFYMRDIRWFFKGTMAGNHYGPHGYERVISITSPAGHGIAPDILEKTLRQRYSASGFLIPHPPYPPYNEAEFDAHFNLRYRNAKGSIYTFKN